MVPFFPKQIANRAIVIYLIALFSVSLLYFSYVMSWGFIALGIICVFAFFGLTVYWTKEWRSIPEKVFVKNIFLIALLIRWIWVVFSFFYYKKVTGIPFEYAAADSFGYHEVAVWLSEERWPFIWEYYFGHGQGVSDVGYPLYMITLYKLLGQSLSFHVLINL
jgi:hypothetical protein